METREFDDIELRWICEHVWEIPRGGEINAPTWVLASEALLDHIDDDKTLEQLRNATHLSSIIKRAIYIPGGHQGYGFPVSGVGTAGTADGYLSPGAVGYNINRGARMMTTNPTYENLQGYEEGLVDALFETIPSGLGGGDVVRDGAETIGDILARGIRWAVNASYTTDDDLIHRKDEGFRDDARPEFVSQKAKDHGRNQIDNLGSGNHFLEIQHVTGVYRDDVAESFGLKADQIVVLTHCGSRELGHQTCTDYPRRTKQEYADLLDDLSNKELAAAPIGSEFVEECYSAIRATINFA